MVAIHSYAVVASEAKQSRAHVTRPLDYFVAALVAMTGAQFGREPF